MTMQLSKMQRAQSRAVRNVASRRPCLVVKAQQVRQICLCGETLADEAFSRVVVYLCDFPCHTLMYRVESGSTQEFQVYSAQLLEIPVD